jgi:hypothetical protein
MLYGQHQQHLSVPVPVAPFTGGSSHLFSHVLDYEEVKHEVFALENIFILI